MQRLLSTLPESARSLMNMPSSSWIVLPVVRNDAQVCEQGHLDISKVRYLNRFFDDAKVESRPGLQKTSGCSAVKGQSLPPR
ncbi:hypothetical protein [Ralstonia solanacearum]|uniref:hypothetical protein n=1 Tax=Ralstonia solanacearum TaxID=305 RepID=UPI00078EF6FD|nr:hypothetical protein [Ralstonia solanacearum]AMP37387.1 hypothetical protein LBM2029_07470 [Ralstonia solanacearum]AXV86209.1 hypothetical protein CJO78_07755 [Ralstonia solanacearum]